MLIFLYFNPNETLHKSFHVSTYNLRIRAKRSQLKRNMSKAKLIMVPKRSAEQKTTLSQGCDCAPDCVRYDYLFIL